MNRLQSAHHHQGCFPLELVSDVKLLALLIGPGVVWVAIESLESRDLLRLLAMQSVRQIHLRDNPNTSFTIQDI